MKSYVSVAIAELTANNNIGIETISVSSESCDLAGAWVLEPNNKNDLENILHGKLIVLIGNIDETAKVLIKYKSHFVKINDFLNEAIEKNKISIQAFEAYKNESDRAYEEFMAIKPAERKLLPKVNKKQLTPPDFHEWPREFNFIDSDNFLLSNRRTGKMKSADADISNVLTSSRAVKLFVDWWMEDEILRSNSMFDDVKGLEPNLLPNCWMNLV